MQAPLRRLIAGLDTIQAAYYLRPHFQGAFEFEPLMVAKERLRADKSRKGELLRIGGQSFLLQGYGSKSGYPLVLDHADFTIECGEFNNPSFFVTYRSKALWEKGAKVLHEFFVTWAESVGLLVVRREKLSRVDFAFDYELPAPDFHSDSVVSLSAKDAQYRGDRKVQPFNTVRAMWYFGSTTRSSRSRSRATRCGFSSSGEPRGMCGASSGRCARKC